MHKRRQDLDILGLLAAMAVICWEAFSMVVYNPATPEDAEGIKSLLA
jgi:hypothetical protein